MKDVCDKCGREYKIRSEASAGVCDVCRFGSEIVPYKAEPRENTRKAYIREKTLSTGASIRIARFVEPGRTGDCGVNITYLSAIKDGRRTELRFALSDEAAAATHWMLAEFFGIGMSA